MKKILLIYPGGKNIGDISMPLPLLLLAKPLIDNGYEVRALDSRVEDYEKLNYEDFLYAGISTLSSNQLSYALEISRYIRRKFPELPLIWGGPHPTLVPEQTAKSKLVDLVVRGEGEETLLELTEKIEKGENWESVKGITFEKEDKIISNPPRKFLDIDNVTHLPYHLLKPDAYPKLKYTFEYFSSKGCPHNCGFCSNVANSGRTWRAKSPEVIIVELEQIVKTIRPERIHFVDANFFVDKKRVERICQLLIEKNWPVTFDAMCRCDYMDGYDDSFMELLRDAKFNELWLGAESGSKRVLEFIEKGITPKQVINARQKCVRYGIRPIFSFIIGIPTETKEEFAKSLELYDKILSMDPYAVINGIFVFTPFPGAPLTKFVKIRYNYQQPKSLEEWKSWQFSSTNYAVWIDKKTQSQYETVSAISRFNYARQLMGIWPAKERRKRVGSFSLVLISQILLFIFGIMAVLRWKFRFFKYGIEWKLWTMILERFKGNK